MDNVTKAPRTFNKITETYKNCVIILESVKARFYRRKPRVDHDNGQIAIPR